MSKPEHPLDSDLQQLFDEAGEEPQTTTARALVKLVQELRNLDYNAQAGAYSKKE